VRRRKKKFVSGGHNGLFAKKIESNPKMSLQKTLSLILIGMSGRTRNGSAGDDDEDDKEVDEGKT